jgi:formylglycine-generating enzyme required for sulfatase activity
MPLVLPFLAALLNPVQDPLPDPRQVRVENPDRCTLVLHRVLDDASDLVERLGDAAEIERALPADRCYWIEVTQDGRCSRVPLPLPRRARIADPLVVRVRTPPPEHPDWAFVPGGPALRGDVLGVGQEDERPARVLDVPAFWLGRREVTNREYAAFLDAAEGAPDPAWIDLTSRKCRIRRDPATGRWTTDAPDLPVVTVSWSGADAYCAWRTRASGHIHRLPTELEWEKAARGPESFTFAYGNIYAVARANQESGALAPVGATGTPNGFGLSDMTGNAFEWVADRYARDAYAGAAPDDAGAAIGYRVLRGGSFVLDGMYLRNSFRMKLRPSVRTDDIGFRVLREEAPPPEETR